MEALYETPHGPMKCYANCLVFRLVGDGISQKAAKEIMSYAYKHYGKRKFVFISNREFASNIDPKAYVAINPKLMVGLAIVSAEDAVREEAMNEQELFDGSFSYFKTIEEAIDWANTVVEA
ncbi:MAG: thymidylate synthase [Marinirhabdus sp.]|nr:thymidylate synthase [Marinirhabdus sp.]